MNLFDSATLQSLLQTGSMLGLFIVVFLIARWAKYASAGYDIHKELVETDNVAVAITIAGYYLAVTVVFAGAYLGPSQGLLIDLGIVGGYTVLGIVLVNIARLVNEAFLLHRFSVRKELLEDRNLGVGFVLFANYLEAFLIGPSSLAAVPLVTAGFYSKDLILSSAWISPVGSRWLWAAGLIGAGSIHGEGGGPLTAIVFFVVGQIALIAFTWVYDLITPYSLHEELEQGNVAAGIGYSGALIAIGLIVMNAVSGDFVSWRANGINLAIQISVIIIYLPLVRLFFDRIMLPGAELNREITEDRNVAAGTLEFASAVGFSAILTMVV